MRPTLRTLFLHGGDILKSPGMQIAKENMQHGSVSVFEHSVCVALVCLWLVHRLHLKVNQRALVRGALLHDYFLYDWHTPDPAHRLHGFRHAGTALRNADRDFELSGHGAGHDQKAHVSVKSRPAAVQRNSCFVPCR